MIRQAQSPDLPQIIDLLRQVADIHHRIRPDLFESNATKYDESELKRLISSNQNPIFVYVEDNVVMGYVFCQIQQVSDNRLLCDRKTLYIDDLCVGQLFRRKNIGQSLFDYAVEYANHIGCHNLTLNVWNGNDAASAFYQHQGMTIQKTTMEILLHK